RPTHGKSNQSPASAARQSRLRNGSTVSYPPSARHPPEHRRPAPRQTRTQRRPAHRIGGIGVQVATLYKKRNTNSCEKPSHRVRRLLSLVGLLQVPGHFILRALRVIAGPLRQLILVDGALALAANVEDLAQVDVPPHFGPLRIEIAVERFAKFIRRRLIIILEEEYFADAIVCERAVLGG